VAEDSVQSRVEQEGDGRGSLKGRALRSAAFTFLRYGGTQVVRLGGNLVLTRLLVPEAFGLLGLVAVLMQGLEMLSDLGIQAAIIRSERGKDREFLDTAWTVQVMRGLLLWVAGCALAIPFAHFYEEDILVYVVPVVTFMSVINGFASTKLATLNRDLHLGRVTALELIAQIAGLVLMVGFAFVYRNVWPLVAGAVLTALVRTVLSFTFLPGPNDRFRWSPDARAELMSFGRWIMLSTALTFAAQSADRLIFGKLVPMELLGIYGIGKMLAEVPAHALSQVGNRVVFPVYSEILAGGAPLREVFGRVRRPLLVLTGWSVAILAASGDAVIDILYDERYAQAGWVLQMVAAATWFYVLETANGGALLALGMPKWVAVATGAKAIGICALLPLGFTLFGFRGAVAALIVAEVLQYVASAYAVTRQGLQGWLSDMPLTALTAVSIALALGAASMVDNPFVVVVLATAVATAVWLPVALPVLREARSRRAANAT
jgi:O-antigen/teichoic acid export membrane protein